MNETLDNHRASDRFTDDEILELLLLINHNQAYIACKKIHTDLKVSFKFANMIMIEMVSEHKELLSFIPETLKRDLEEYEQS